MRLTSYAKLEKRSKRIEWTWERYSEVVVQLSADDVHRAFTGLHEMFDIAKQAKVSFEIRFEFNSIDMVWRFLVDVARDVETAILVGRIIEILKKQFRGRIHRKNGDAAYAQAVHQLQERTRVVEPELIGQRSLKDGYEFVFRDYEGTIHVYDIKHRCDIDYHRYERRS